MLIEDILEDAAPNPVRAMTPVEDFHADNVGAEDEDNVGPMD